MMWIIEAINGVVRKPYVVFWNQMDNACRIVTKSKAFRTPDQANRFIRYDLPHIGGFLRVVHLIARGNGRPVTQYDI